jgi:hypothetical protein
MFLLLNSVFDQINQLADKLLTNPTISDLVETCCQILHAMFPHANYQAVSAHLEILELKVKNPLALRLFGRILCKQLSMNLLRVASHEVRGTKESGATVLDKLVELESQWSQDDDKTTTTDLKKIEQAAIQLNIVEVLLSFELGVAKESQFEYTTRSSPSYILQHAAHMMEGLEITKDLVRKMEKVPQWLISRLSTLIDHVKLFEGTVLNRREEGKTEKTG